jgi:hypothetical protein
MTRADQYVVRFDIPMDNFVLMGMVQRFSNLRRNVNRFFYIQWGPLSNDLFQGGTFDVFHDDIVYIFLKTNIIYVDDIRVRQTGCGLGFPFEPAHKFVVARKFRT